MALPGPSGAAGRGASIGISSASGIAAGRAGLSGAFTGWTKLTGRHVPGCGWQPGGRSEELKRANPVYAAWYQHLTGREQNKLTPSQAKAVITTGQAWEAVTAAHGTRRESRGARRLTRSAAPQAGGRGEPSAALRHPR